MLRTCAFLALPALVLSFAPSPRTAPPGGLEFDRAKLILEANATDGDAEIVLDLKADFDIVRLELAGPACSGDGDGRRVLELHSNKDLRLGLSQILVETGEPSLAAVLAAFPAGSYELSGRTLEGRRFETQLELTHALPRAPEILFPADGDENIPVEGLVIQWSLDHAVSSWLVELEREDDLPGKIVAILPGETSLFAVPAGFLQSGVEYQVGVRASSAQGNVSVSELVFVTL